MLIYKIVKGLVKVLTYICSSHGPIILYRVKIPALYLMLGYRKRPPCGGLGLQHYSYLMMSISLVLPFLTCFLSWVLALWHTRHSVMMLFRSQPKPPSATSTI